MNAELPDGCCGSRYVVEKRGNRRKMMVTVDRRTMLATGALALAGAAAQTGGAEAQAGPKPIFPVPVTTIPIVGETDRRVCRPPHLLHRAQLCRACDRAWLRPDPRAAVLFPEADRRHPERRDRRGRGSSLSVADQELSP